MYTYQFQHI